MFRAIRHRHSPRKAVHWTGIVNARASAATPRIRPWIHSAVTNRGESAAAGMHQAQPFRSVGAGVGRADPGDPGDSGIQRERAGRLGPSRTVCQSRRGGYTKTALGVFAGSAPHAPRAWVCPRQCQFEARQQVPL